MLTLIFYKKNSKKHINLQFTTNHLLVLRCTIVSCKKKTTKKKTKEEEKKK